MKLRENLRGVGNLIRARLISHDHVHVAKGQVEHYSRNSKLRQCWHVVSMTATTPFYWHNFVLKSPSTIYETYVALDSSWMILHYEIKKTSNRNCQSTSVLKILCKIYVALGLYFWQHNVNRKFHDTIFYRGRFASRFVPAVLKLWEHGGRTRSLVPRSRVMDKDLAHPVVLRDIG